MPTIVNHLLNRDAQRRFLEVSFGRRVVKGDLTSSYSETVGDSFQVSAFNALGEGEWDGCEAAYYAGLNIPEDDYNFHSGALATGYDSGPQQTDTFFDEDVPHTRTATIGYKVPEGIGDENTKANPPTNFEGIFRTKKCSDFNSAGVKTDFSYTANPAREIVEILLTYARMPFIPTAYANMAEYWLSRFDWANWTEFRDYHDTHETVDYRLHDFAGFGISVEYFEDQTFTTLHTKRVEPSINLQMGSGSPAVGLDADDLSGRLEGFIKAEYTEEYAFHLVLTDLIAQVWIDDVSIVNKSTVSTGTFTGTANLTADTFHKIKVEFIEASGDANLRLDWSSTSQTQQPIPTKRSYPKVHTQPRYESHLFFDPRTPPIVAIRKILELTNSIMQDVNGKLRFYCLEQLASEFLFDSSNIIEGTFNFSRRDILRNNPTTDFEAQFNYLDYQYLEELPTAISVKVEDLQGQPPEKVQVVNLFNTNPWQARKVLVQKAKFEAANELLNSLESTNAKSYPVMPGCRVTVNHRKTGNIDKDYLVRKITETSIGEGSSDVIKRKFTLQELN